jgi:ribosomal protein S18 acetylase RimI-like enzyme
LNFRKLNKEEFEYLRRLSPKSVNLEKYKKQRLEELDKKEIDIFVIEDNGIFIGELTINYINHKLETETIPGKRVYLEAFRIDKEFQGQGLGQKLIKYCIDTLSNNGYTEFTVGVEENNEKAKHIYFKYGFTEAIDRGYGDEFDPVSYILYLMKL